MALFHFFFSVAHAFKFVSIDMVLDYTNASVLELWSLIKIIGHRSRVIDLLKEARNSFLDLGVYLLKSKFHIEDKLRFP